MKKFLSGLFVGAVALAVTMVVMIMNEVHNL